MAGDRGVFSDTGIANARTGGLNRGIGETNAALGGLGRVTDRLELT